MAAIACPVVDLASYKRFWGHQVVLVQVPGSIFPVRSSISRRISIYEADLCMLQFELSSLDGLLASWWVQACGHAEAKQISFSF